MPLGFKSVLPLLTVYYLLLATVAWTWPQNWPSYYQVKWQLKVKLQQSLHRASGYWYLFVNCEAVEVIIPSIFSSIRALEMYRLSKHKIEHNSLILQARSSTVCMVVHPENTQIKQNTELSMMK